MRLQVDKLALDIATRFGAILPLWQFFGVFFSIWQNIELTLANVVHILLSKFLLL